MKLLDGIVKKRVGKGAALLLAQLFASGSRGKCHRDRHAPSHTPKETISILKGSMTRDFQLLVFVSQIRFPSGPDYPIGAISIFSENSRIYS